jgi:hypothetical protein
LANSATFYLCHESCRAVNLRNDLPRFAGEGSANVGKLNYPFCSIKELYTQFPFELTNLPTKRRLANIQQLCCLTKVQLFTEH